MKNPFGNQQIPEPPGPYHVVKKRVYKKVSAKVNDHIRITLQNTYENALSEESVRLSPPERKRLFSEIVNMVMEDIAGSSI
jgi:hypothetical protein